MCTSIAMQQGGGIFGRNLDLECSFGEQGVVMPRQFPLQLEWPIWQRERPSMPRR